MAVIITVASQIVSGKSLYPQEFKVFFSDRIATENAQSLRYEDDVLVLDEKTSVKAQKMRINEKNILDLRAVDPEKKFSKAAISAVIYSEKNAVLRMGMGADWWFDCYCNGKYIFGTTQAGNLFWPPSVSSFVFEIPLRVGRNELTIFTRSGEGGWTVAVGEPPANADLNQTRQEPLKAKVLYGPYLTNPAPTSITVSYVVQGRQPLELEYRKKGNKVWKKLQLLRGGQLIEDERVMLSLLKMSRSFGLILLICTLIRFMNTVFLNALAANCAMHNQIKCVHSKHSAINRRISVFGSWLIPRLINCTNLPS